MDTAMKKIYNKIAENALYIAWVIAVVATTGSTYVSDIRKYAPCILCWYQRIFMFPLVIILPIAIAKKDRFISSYVNPLVIIGGLIAFYHHLLQIGVIPEGLVECTGGVSCKTKYIDFLGGYLTIPLMSFLAFLGIFICMIIYKKYHHEPRN